MGFDSEKIFQRDVVRALEGVGSWILNFHGHGYGRSGIPDLFVANRKWSGWIELKIGNKKPTDLQVVCMKDLLCRGVPSFVVRGYESSMVCELWNRVGHRGEGGDDYEILSYCKEWTRIKGLGQGFSLLEMLIVAGEKALEIVKSG